MKSAMRIGYLSILCSAFLLLSCSTEPTEIYTLSTASSPQEAGTVTPAQGEFDDGTEVEILAEANENWVFSGWQGDHTGSGNPTTVVLDRDKSVIAQFEKREYTLTMETIGEGTIEEELIASKTTDHPYGSVVQLTAVPEAGWLFSEWQGDLSGDENPIEITIEGEASVTAVFVEEPAPEVTIIQTGINNWLYASEFLNEDTGWVGGNGILMKTTDGGASWSTQLDGNFTISDITFLDENIGWATSYNNSFLETENQGIFSTDDGGDTWTLVYETDDRPFTIFFLDENNGWVAGMNDLILHTSDAGQTWDVQNNFEGTFENPDLSFWIADMKFSDENNGWGVGMYSPADNYLIINTTDGGQTWEMVASNLGNRLNFLHLLDDENIITGSRSINTYSKGDSGMETIHALETPTNLFDIGFVTESRGFVVGAMDYILETKDGGTNWGQIELDDEYQLEGISASGNILWAAGRDGALIKVEF